MNMACMQSSPMQDFPPTSGVCDGHPQDLQEWRKRLHSQVQGYQAEIGGLRSKLLGEMDALKAEFLGLRATLQQQMASTWAAVGGPEAPATASEAPVVAQAAEDA